MRSAVINESTSIVENICVAEPVNPSPYAGYIMVGLQDAVWDYTVDPPVEVSPATPCDIGWIYDPVTGTFSAP